MARFVAIGSRRDHPRGYGFGETAHGYSTLFVPCDNDLQLQKVINRFEQGPVVICYPDGWTAWFGGYFDYVGCVGGEYVTAYMPSGSTSPACISLGDNRAITIVTAREFLSSDAKSALQKLSKYL